MKKIVLLCSLICSVSITLVLLILSKPTAILTTENNSLVLKTTCHFHQETLKVWHNETNDTYHFFLPAYMRNLQCIKLEGTSQKYTPDELEYSGTPVEIHFSSNLPAVFITTESADNTTLQDDKNYKEPGQIKTINNNGEVHFSSELEYITGRGNSTWDFEKKPYTLKFTTASSPCDMTPQKKWVLLANAYEGTKISYKMMLDLASYMGLEHTPEARWIDLYMNGEYQGNYLLCQAIDLNSGCIDIPNGILVEKDFPDYYADEEYGFTLNDILTFSIKAPGIVTEEQIDSISKYFHIVDSLIREGDTSYTTYLDTDSVATHFLFDELAYNSDSCITSTFFYKEMDDGPLVMNPVWDFDGAFGETNGQWTNYEGTILDIINTYRSGMYLDWYNQLYENDIEFQDNVIATYSNMLPYLEYLVNDGINEYASYIYDSVYMDMIRWDYGENTAGHYASFENNVRYLKFFLSKRIETLNHRWGLTSAKLYELGNGDIHTVTYESNGTSYEEEVPDGSFLPPLPIFEGQNWHYQRDKVEYSPYLPVLEDMCLQLY